MILGLERSLERRRVAIDRAAEKVQSTVGAIKDKL